MPKFTLAQLEVNKEMFFSIVKNVGISVAELREIYSWHVNTLLHCIVMVCLDITSNDTLNTFFARKNSDLDRAPCLLKF